MRTAILIQIMRVFDIQQVDKQRFDQKTIFIQSFEIYFIDSLDYCVFTLERVPFNDQASRF